MVITADNSNKNAKSIFYKELMKLKYIITVLLINKYFTKMNLLDQEKEFSKMMLHLI